MTRAARSSTTAKLSSATSARIGRQLEGVHQLVVGPRRGDQLDGQRGDHLARDGVRTADRRRAADGLEVDEHVGAVVVAADAHQAGVRRVAERPLVRLGGLAVETPAAAVLERDPRRRRVRGGGRDAELDLVVVDRDRVDRRQRDALGLRRSRRAAAGPGRPARRGRGRHRRAARPRSRSAEADRSAPRRRRRSAAMRAGERRRQQTAADQVARQSVVPARRLHGVGLVRRRRSTTGTRSRSSSLLVGAGDAGAGCSGVDPVGTDGVVRQHQHPAGLDQPADDQLAAVGLRAALVELEDLLPAPPVAEVLLGDVPQVVVVAPLGRPAP